MIYLDKSERRLKLYEASSVEFPELPGQRAMKVNAPEDLDKYQDGYTNPDLIRILDPDPVEFDAPDEGHSVPFNPYDHTPQFELAPRDYLLYISGTNSYRLTQYHNHDEESTFWENP